MPATQHSYPPYVMSQAEAADYLRISPRSLTGLQARGEITPKKLLGSKKGYLREDLEEWARRQPEWEIKIWNPHPTKK